jgi:hypothetical protein
MRQYFAADDTGVEHPVCPKPPIALMRSAVGKTFREFLRTVTVTPYISQEYSSSLGTEWLLGYGRSSKRLSTIANAQRREYLEIPT